MATDALPLEPADYRRWQLPAYVAGGAGFLLCAPSWFLDAPAFYRVYLWAYMFVLGITLGSLVLDLLQFLTGGVWGLVLRRPLEAMTRTLPVMALLFLPLFIGFLVPARDDGTQTSEHRRSQISSVYVWADPAVTEHDHALQFKASWYLNVPFFLGRAVAYFAIWLTLSYLLNRWSPATDQPGADEPRHLRMLSAGGLLLYGLTITFASVDWIMSLEPHWFSSIFGVLVGVGQVLSALAFAIIVLVLVADRPPLAAVVGRPLLRDLGSLMLAFVMVWAYLAFSQFLLIWSGNLPAEIPYYLRRFQGGFEWVAVALVLFHFFLPFVLLLSRDVKRTRRTLLTVAALVLGMRAVDLFWMIIPAQPGPDGLGAAHLWLGWSGLLALVGAPVGMGGIWLGVFLGELPRYRLLPEHDPRMAETLHHE